MFYLYLSVVFSTYYRKSANCSLTIYFWLAWYSNRNEERIIEQLNCFDLIFYVVTVVYCLNEHIVI